jgi:hypothetical protein
MSFRQYDLPHIPTAARKRIAERMTPLIHTHPKIRLRQRMTGMIPLGGMSG